jgi:hypothetical protein
MGAVNSSLLAIAAALATAGTGLCAIMMAKHGIAYAISGGNPRAQAEAYSGLINTGKGLLLLGSSAAIVAWMAGIIHFA